MTMNSLIAVKDLDACTFVASNMDHWRRAWAGLGIEQPPAKVFDELLKRYGEVHRAYHTREHLEECLVLLDEAWGQCEHPEEVAIALWFHDAIYQPHRSDNEVASAKWLAEVGNEIGMNGRSIERMQALVLATRHTTSVEQPDAQILVDIDLSILGASPERFDAYEAQIRREYRWVPGPIYRMKRADVLKSFLGRSMIYHTSLFRDRFEERARRNIGRSLAMLRRYRPL
jgi:predicted metal-dependent HD superfamily phosphohydrolase